MERQYSGLLIRCYTSAMHRIATALTLVLSIALLSATSTGVQADSGRKLYKWVDEKGVVHYGDSVPPQYSKKEARILNERGIEIGRREAEKTDAERAAEQAKSQAAANSKQRDQILLNTYVSVAQIEELRDQRLDLVEGQIKVTSQYVATLNNRLGELQTRAQTFKPYSSDAKAKQMPDGLAEDLVRAVNDLKVQELNLNSKRAEQDEMRREFQADIERYKELRGIR